MQLHKVKLKALSLLLKTQLLNHDASLFYASQVDAVKTELKSFTAVFTELFVLKKLK